MTRSRLQIGAGLAAKMYDLHFLVDNDAGRNEAVKQNPVGGLFYADRRLLFARNLGVLEPANTILHAVEIGNKAADALFLLKYAVLLVDSLEIFGKGTQTLRPSKHQVALGFEGVVQSRNYALLQHCSKIDQQVAATDEIQIGEGRIFGNILACENTHFPHRLVD